MHEPFELKEARGIGFETMVYVRSSLVMYLSDRSSRRDPNWIHFVVQS